MSSAVADDFQKTPQVEVGVKKENQATKNKKKPNEKSKNHARARKADSEEPHSSNAKKTQEPKRPTLLSLAREKFEEFYLQATGENYYWAAKDAANMGQLLKKIRFSREKRGKPLPVDDLSLCDALWQFLTSITTEWVLNNLSVPIINSKFNEIKSEIRNRQNQAKLPTRNGTEPRQPTATRQFASSAERNAAIIQSQRLSICTAMQQTLDGQRDIPGFPNLAPLTDGE